MVPPANPQFTSTAIYIIAEISTLTKTFLSDTVPISVDIKHVRYGHCMIPCAHRQSPQTGALLPKQSS